MRSGPYWFCSSRLIPDAIKSPHLRSIQEHGINCFLDELGQKNPWKLVLFCFESIFSSWQNDVHFISCHPNVCVRFRLCPHGVHFRPCCETCHVWEKKKAMSSDTETKAYPMRFYAEYQNSFREYVSTRLQGVKIFASINPQLGWLIWVPSCCVCGSLGPIGCRTSGTRCGGSSGTFQW